MVQSWGLGHSKEFNFNSDFIFRKTCPPTIKNILVFQGKCVKYVSKEISDNSHITAKAKKKMWFCAIKLQLEEFKEYEKLLLKRIQFIEYHIHSL